MARYRFGMAIDDAVVVLRDVAPALGTFMLRFVTATPEDFLLCIPDTPAFLNLEGVTADLASVKPDATLVPLASTWAITDVSPVFRASWLLGDVGMPTADWLVVVLTEASRGNGMAQVAAERRT